MKHTPAMRLRHRAALCVCAVSLVFGTPIVYRVWTRKETPEDLEKFKQIQREEEIRTLKLRRILYEDRHKYSKRVDTKSVMD